MGHLKPSFGWLANCSVVTREAKSRIGIGVVAFWRAASHAIDRDFGVELTDSAA
jgi:hypothetical protein